jgi:TetR/AcrR family transcriptional regulator
MIKEKNISAPGTELRILDAAKKIFILNGLDGTTMQQIANEAKINKSLLHYYFRSKEKLFESVFTFAFKHFLPGVKEILDTDIDLFKKIENIVNKYMDMLISNKFIPAFVLHEINRNPEKLYELFVNSGLIPQIILDEFSLAMEKGLIRRLDPKHLIINILSLCVFPVAARPLIQRVFFDNHDQAYQQFLEERKKVVTDFIIQSIKL